MDRRTRAVEALSASRWCPDYSEPIISLTHPEITSVIILVAAGTIACVDAHVERTLAEYDLGDWHTAREFARGYHMGKQAAAGAPLVD